jgi:flavodoxin
MKALVVCDSYFGNTEKIALAIGDALKSHADVQVMRVGDARPGRLVGLELLVVGSPTRGFSASPATKGWLKTLAPNSLRGTKVASFDTRIALSDVNARVFAVFVNLFGYAAEPIAKSLAKRGGTLVIPAEGFFVKDTEGPLKDGELERAAAWAQRMNPFRGQHWTWTAFFIMFLAFMR